MRKLIYAALLSLSVFSASIPAVSGNPKAATATFPYITSSSVFPRRSKTPSIAHIVRHSFKLQVPSQSRPLSQLIIGVPKGLKMPKNVKVSDASSQAVVADVVMNDHQIAITFPQPVAPGTLLTIAMNNVQVAGLSNGWLYPISTQVVGLSYSIPIGFARFNIGH